jgi:tetratricopeptide (TPR) repeat protein
MTSPPSLRDVEAAVQRGDIARASALARAAVEGGRRHPLLFNLLAHASEEQHRYAEAVEHLKRGLEIAPQDPTLLTSLGMCLGKIERRSEAVAAFKAALDVAPDFPGALSGLAENLTTLGHSDAARGFYERALRLAPDYAEPWVGLATLTARSGDAAGARAYAERALRLAPAHPAAVGVLAMAEIAEKQFEAAERRLRALLAGPVEPIARANAWCILGDAQHGQGRTDEAFEAYTEGGRLFREVYAPVFAAGESLPDRITRLTAWLEAAPASIWDGAGAGDGPARGHAFLMGFHRSGTTLLEQVLAGHPDVVALEEKPTLVEPEHEFVLAPGGLDRLAALDEAGIARLRANYWQRVRAFGVEPEGKLFLDKMPFNTINLAVIAKLFPEAKVLFARRDPRDVVLSCFRKNFRANAAMYQMLDPVDAARLYDLVMTHAEVARAKLPLPVHEVRYERLVADFEAEARAAVAFLGLDWREEMKDFVATSRTRSIATPSAAQVRQGLYREGAGQWRRYAAHLQGALPILRPWVERYGYDPD